MRLKVKTLVWSGVIAGAAALVYVICRVLRLEPLRLDHVALLFVLACSAYVVFKVYRSKVECPYDALPIITHHQQPFDGGGYPSGLHGEEIPLGARLLSIVACFDALTTNRPYRHSYRRDEALNIMRGERGRMFDPALLD